MEPITPKLRRKYTNQGAGPKAIKQTKAGNGKREGRGKLHGSFTHCPPGTGDGKAPRR